MSAKRQFSFRRAALPAAVTLALASHSLPLLAQEGLSAEGLANLEFGTIDYGVYQSQPYTPICGGSISANCITDISVSDVTPNWVVSQPGSSIYTHLEKPTSVQSGSFSITNKNHLTLFNPTATSFGSTDNLPPISITSAGLNNGAAGSNLEVTNSGDMMLGGLRSMGILAQSLGATGSSGSTGGNGGSVSATNTGTIFSGITFTNIPQNVPYDARTVDTVYDAPSIVAKSIGGFGGSGTSECETFFCFYSYGTDGGNGGNANEVKVTNSGGLFTFGEQSSGIYALSIGGNGGLAGKGAGLVSIGGSGGNGGEGADVSVINSGEVYAQNSRGIQAQSISGGGGDGGKSDGLVSIGGHGGGSESSGNVTVTNTGDIKTALSAIVAQSTAGGGGTGGSTGGLASIGGSSASGGSAGNVTVNNQGNLFSRDSHNSVIHAQSIGGGGGHGGNSLGVGLFGSLAIGGSGSEGGTGGDVSVYNTGSLTLSPTIAGFFVQNFSHGVFAQSIGGGGGSGGSSASYSVGFKADVALSLGGSGGDGASSGTVNVWNCGQNTAKTACDSTVSTGSITTAGSHSSGIFAQSVGGGGGVGGMSVSAAASNGVTLSASMGGSGGNGGTGADVNVFSKSASNTMPSEGFQNYLNPQNPGDLLNGITNSHDINTQTDFSSGIFAQSVGGGGGASGTSMSYAAGNYTANLSDGGSSLLSFGGSSAGSSGSSAGAVTVNSNSSIAAFGSHSTGIVAQSIGGGGGHGGMSISGTLAAAGSVSVGMGASGGGGGDGSAVTVNTTLLGDGTGAVNAGNNGDVLAIMTQGYHADGILAQSIGGGGGSGGASISGAISGSSSAELSLGGVGGNGATAGHVSVNNMLGISTASDHSKGIVAQSIGGGGGNTGASISAGLSASSNLSLSESSLHFGAGAGSGALTDGATGGTGGLVDLTSAAQIDTTGAFSTALLAQSIGGGGGHGGISGSFSLSLNSGLSASMGGAGGSGNTGGAVNVLASSRSISKSGAYELIGTGGDHSHGILAQSIGGGGGAGGMAISGNGNLKYAPSLAMGGDGGSGSHGGAVSVSTEIPLMQFGDIPASSARATIAASGDLSSAIMAQSIGGGGGHGANSISFAAGEMGFGFAALPGGTHIPGWKFGNRGGVGGDASAVTVHNQMMLSSTGAPGLLAQSIGGGGGSGGTKISGDFSLDPESGVGLSFGASGVAGSNGGTGASVTVDAGFNPAVTTENYPFPSQGDITTGGVNAPGILAQSIGAGGGVGGWSMASGIKILSAGEALPALGISMGGTGGNGGTSGNVNITGVSSVTTSGNNSQGVVAQSIGGGGGHGGLAVSFSATNKDSKIGLGNLSAALGGSGGTGATSGAVTVGTAGGSITTLGHNATGILAQSIAGGGGYGGGAIAVSAGLDTISGSVAHGGSGGTGAAVNGAIAVTSNSNISTGLAAIAASGTTSASPVLGNDAPAILAQSIGGGGGSGGFTIAAELGTAEGNQTSTGVSVALGGSGGSGGNANKVSVTSNGTLKTEGARSSGIIAQSLGGGGGNGGFSIASDINISGGTNSDGKNYQASVALGGSAASGGNAAAVDVSQNGNITTTGENAAAIHAQSISGGGGNGGFSIAGNISNGGASLAVSHGGTGGVSGDSDDVTVTANNSNISTQNNTSSGILAQSISGGGGSGGFSIAGGVSFSSLALSNAAVDVGLGGSGGSSGDAAKVIVNYATQTYIGSTNLNQNTALSTQGNDAHGIQAQSISGGGGSGGFAAAEALGGGLGKVNIKMGGDSGTGSDASDVTVNAGVQGNGSSITTSGRRSMGVLAQSIAGGGGISFVEAESFWQKAGDEALDHLISMGHSNSVDSGTAGSIYVTNWTTTTTHGDDAYGILAQSISGGGGFSSSYGGLGANTVLGSTTGSTTPNKCGQSKQIVTYDSAGDPENIQDEPYCNFYVTNFTDVTTSGARASGIVAQSIGAGGGVVSADKLGSITLGAGGVGSASTGLVTNHGSISIASPGAFGIVAQSIGGGGGMVNASTGTTIPSLDLSSPWKGGAGNGGGDASSVQIINNGNINTAGGSFGILAQSVAGGGGVVIDDNSVSLQGGFGSGSSGEVAITNGGAITSTANNVVGIAAYTISGDKAPRKDGIGACHSSSVIVCVSSTANITTTGNNSYAIVAGSYGPGTSSQNGEISITLGAENADAQPVISGGSANGGGIFIHTDHIGTITNYGTLSSAAENRTIVTDGTGKVTLDNYGQFNGLMNFGGTTTGVLNNHAGGVMNLAGGYTLSADLNNNGGTLGISPGRPETLLINGHAFTQTAGSVLSIDYLPDGDEQQYVDEVWVKNGTATIEGAINVNVLKPHQLDPLSGNLNIQTVLYSPNSAIVRGTITANSTPVLNILVAPEDYSGENSLQIVLKPTFAPAGLESSVVPVGQHINNLLGAGKLTADEDTVLTDIISQTSIAGISSIYQQLSPATHTGNSTSTLGHTSQALSNSMSHLQGLVAGGSDNSIASALNPYSGMVLLAYDGDDPTSVLGGYSPTQRNSAVWLMPLRMKVTSDTPAGQHETRFTGLTLGLDHRLNERMTLGANVSLSQANTNFDQSPASSDQDHLNISLQGAYAFGSQYLSGIVSYGSHDFSNRRILSLATGQTLLESEHDGDSLGIGVEWGAYYNIGKVAARPYARVFHQQLDQDAYAEEGNSSFALSFGDQSSDSTLTELGVRLSQSFHFGRGTLVPSLTASWKHEAGDGITSMPSSFRLASGQSYQYEHVHSTEDRGVLGLELSYFDNQRSTFSLVYQREEGNGFETEGWSGRFHYAF